MNENSKIKSNSQNWLILFSLIVAGELIFGLPFHIARFYRPTFLDVFDLNNAQLGDAIAIYGIAALLSYFPGGVIADRFSARKLMSISLIGTGLGGVCLTTIPGQAELSVLFGYWGVTTILLFWSSMLRATREWGGKLAQGRAFGLLDGGRGLVASTVATIGVLLLSTLLPDNLASTSPEERIKALKAVIWFYTLLTFGSAFLIWYFIPETNKKNLNFQSFKGIKKVLQRRSTLLQAIIVICAYCGFKGLDFYAQYGMEVLGMDEVEAARFVTNASYLRPVAAIGIGFIADRLSIKRTIVATFMLAFFGYLFLSILSPGETDFVLIFVNLIFTFTAVYALRGVYFALFEETHVPENITGTTIGVVSLVGFSPNIFFNSVAGRIIDNSPGIGGYHQFYLFMGIFALVGLAASFLLKAKLKN